MSLSADLRERKRMGAEAPQPKPTVLIFQRLRCRCWTRSSAWVPVVAQSSSNAMFLGPESRIN